MNKPTTGYSYGSIEEINKQAHPKYLTVLFSTCSANKEIIKSLPSTSNN